MSDHDIISCSLLHPEFLSSPPSRPLFQGGSPFDDINFFKADWDTIRYKLVETDWSTVSDSLVTSGQDTAWDNFEGIVASICAQNAPSHSRSRMAPSTRIPKDRQILLRKKKKINARINILKNSYDIPIKSSLAFSQLELNRAKTEIQIKDSINQERSREEMAAIEKIKINPKAFYFFVKKSASYTSPVGPLENQLGELVSDPKDMGSLLQTQYSKVFSNPNMVDPDEATKNIPSVDYSIDDMPFSVSDILDAIKDMSAFSAAGPDKFPVAILKECGELLAPIIHKLWCASLETGIIAEKFKSQAVIPIFKGGSKAIPANYRPVSLTSHIIKLFERVVRKKMISFIEEHNLIHPKQHGFRKGRSCLTQLLDHFDDVLRDLNSDANSDVIYLDFSKAFDKVDHRILLKKLHKYGIRGNLHRWLQSFLSDRTQHVVIDGVSSTKTKVVSGVPQGTVLGPLLFL